MVQNVVRRYSDRLYPNHRRVITRLFIPEERRAEAILQRTLALDDYTVQNSLALIVASFGSRHRDILSVLYENARALGGLGTISEERKLLIGAMFTSEFAIEGAGLCNPSIVPHPDQSGIVSGSLRFVMGVRCIGEGHRSSIGFRIGVIDSNGRISFENVSLLATSGQSLMMTSEVYRIEFSNNTTLSERVLWPVLANERNGMEDARFVRFIDGDRSIYYATYTAYDGVNISQRLLQTSDFIRFTSSPITGRFATGKGLALFPRKIGRKYAALCRSNGETNMIAFSLNMNRWDDAITYQIPTYPWELLQVGNCGSPIETEAGWLVLTHGVGPMKTYSIGALLLDLDDPSRVIGRLAKPFLSPYAFEQDGYVPNAIYSCGSLIHAGSLILPYGIADSYIGVTFVSVGELLDSLHDVAVVR